MDKEILRTKLLRLRDSLDPDVRRRADMQIMKKLQKNQSYKDADLVLTYISFGSEVDTHVLVSDALAQGKDVAIPHCLKDKAMQWLYLSDSSELMHFEGQTYKVPSKFIESANVVNINEYRCPVAIVPGLMFDRLGFRLGYGGGYYDIFLRDFSSRSIGLIRSDFLVDDLSQLIVIEDFDLPVDEVICS